jgi:hypothetical protein
MDYGLCTYTGAQEPVQREALKKMRVQRDQLLSNVLVWGQSFSYWQYLANTSSLQNHAIHAKAEPIIYIYIHIHIYNSGPPTGKEGNAIWNYIYAEDIYFYKSAGIYGYAFYANACVDFVAVWRRARLPVFISWKVLAQVHSLQSSRWGPRANPCYRRASRTLFKAWHEIPRCSCQHSIDSDSTKWLQYGWMAQWLWELDCERFDLLNRRSVSGKSWFWETRHSEQTLLKPRQVDASFLYLRFSVQSIAWVKRPF